MKISEYISDFFNLLYPNLCLVCSENINYNENKICISCINNIPKTNYHLQQDNPVEKRFWGKVPIEKVTAYFFFEKGSPYQKLLHLLKYKNNKELGKELGKYAAVDLLENSFFRDVDLIVPVPLHPNKLRKRGYNQSEWIAMGLSEILDIPIETSNTIRTIENPTQTKKSVYDRYLNTENIFDIKDRERYAGKHILLVDDVLTTGSTLESCASCILECIDSKVSIFVLTSA